MLQWMCAKGIYDVQKSAHIEYSINSKGEKYDAKIEYWILVRIFSFGLQITTINIQFDKTYIIWKLFDLSTIILVQWYYLQISPDTRKTTLVVSHNELSFFLPLFDVAVTQLLCIFNFSGFKFCIEMSRLIRR